MCWGRLMGSSPTFRTGKGEHRTLNIEPGTLNIGLGGEGRIMTLPRADDSTSLYRPKFANHKERKEHRAAKQKLQERGHSCPPDRKSTRLNSSHRCISYAVFCLK